MKCSTVAKQLSSYNDGELQVNERERIDSHLKQCSQCAEKFEALQAMSNLFTHVQKYEAPINFSTRIMARIESDAPRVFSLWPLFTRFAEAAAILVAITAGITTGGALINSVTTHQKGTVVSSLSLDSFEALPPNSLGRAYLAMTEERQ